MYEKLLKDQRYEGFNPPNLRDTKKHFQQSKYKRFIPINSQDLKSRNFSETKDIRDSALIGL